MKLVQLNKENDLWLFESTGIAYEVEQEFDAIWERFETAGNLELTEMALLFHLERFPNNVDALHHLSIIYCDLNKHFDAYLCSQSAVSICLQAIPKEFDWNTARINYADLNNRPFFRAYKGLGLRYAHKEMYEQAEEIFQRLISLHANDNLGARYELIDLYYKQGKEELIDRLIDLYPDENLLDNYKRFSS